VTAWNDEICAMLVPWSSSRQKKERDGWRARSQATSCCTTGKRSTQEGTSRARSIRGARSSTRASPPPCTGCSRKSSGARRWQLHCLRTRGRRRSPPNASPNPSLRQRKSRSPRSCQRLSRRKPRPCRRLSRRRLRQPLHPYARPNQRTRRPPLRPYPRPRQRRSRRLQLSRWRNLESPSPPPRAPCMTRQRSPPRRCLRRFRAPRAGHRPSHAGTCGLPASHRVRPRAFQLRRQPRPRHPRAFRRAPRNRRHSRRSRAVPRASGHMRQSPPSPWQCRRRSPRE
jgi:hypothetical protein